MASTITEPEKYFHFTDPKILIFSYLVEDMVTKKGRVAAEIQSADELVLTEIIFNTNLKVSISFRLQFWCHCPTYTSCHTSNLQGLSFFLS